MLRTEEIELVAGDVAAPYGPGGSRSYFADVYRAATGDARAADHLRLAGVQARDLTTGAGADGDVPTGAATMPAAIEAAVAEGVSAVAVVAPLLDAQPLPAAGMEVWSAQVATPPAVDVHAAENTAVANTDISLDPIRPPVRTLAGTVVTSRQALERATPALDAIIAREFGRALGARLDVQLVRGDGTAGQVTGLLAAAGSTVTYTSASPTGAELVSAIADAYQQAAAALGQPPTAVVMHPRRAAWLRAEAAAAGFVLDLGAPIVETTAVPTNLGAGTNEDRVILVAGDRLTLHSAPPVVAAHTGLAANPLGVRLVMHQYVAANLTRRPEAVAVVAGTGLVNPW